jgi:putative membrane protein
VPDFATLNIAGLANYMVYILAAGVVLVVFFVIYTWMTPYDEVLLIRQGNTAAALTLGGAIVGFSLTLASVILHAPTMISFLSWSVAGLVVQLLAYLVTTRCLSISKEHIESGNVAYGGLLASISLAVGAINAACIS